MRRISIRSNSRPPVVHYDLPNGSTLTLTYKQGVWRGYVLDYQGEREIDCPVSYAVALFDTLWPTR